MVIFNPIRFNAYNSAMKRTSFGAAPASADKSQEYVTPDETRVTPDLVVDEKLKEEAITAATARIAKKVQGDDNRYNVATTLRDEAKDLVSHKGGNEYKKANFYTYVGNLYGILNNFNSNLPKKYANETLEILIGAVQEIPSVDEGFKAFEAISKRVNPDDFDHTAWSYTYSVDDVIGALDNQLSYFEKFEGPYHKNARTIVNTLEQKREREVSNFPDMRR